MNKTITSEDEAITLKTENDGFKELIILTDGKFIVFDDYDFAHELYEVLDTFFKED